MLKTFLKIVLLIASLPILIPMVVIARLLPKPYGSTEEVLEYLHAMEQGEIDDYGWDHFLNVPVKNKDLDAIRERCGEIWQEKSPFLKGGWGDTDFGLNESGKAEIRALIARCERSRELTKPLR